MTQPASAPSPDFGTAWSCIDDLTMPAVMVTGFRVVAEAIARRWSTPRGGLVDDPNAGFDLTDYVSDDMSSSTLGRLAQALGAEAQKDERVLTCTCTVTFVDEVLIVKGLVVTAAGPFKLVLSVNTLSKEVNLLQVTPQ